MAKSCNGVYLTNGSRTLRPPGRHSLTLTLTLTLTSPTAVVGTGQTQAIDPTINSLPLQHPMQNDKDDWCDTSYWTVNIDTLQTLFNHLNRNMNRALCFLSGSGFSVKQQASTCCTWCETICSLCWFDDPDLCSGPNHVSPCGAYLTLVSPPQVRSVSLGPESAATAEWTGSVFQINPAPTGPVSYQLCRAPQTSGLRTKIWLWGSDKPMNY